ncbi:unnamed protein product, partial [Iphiclides podalirius]
MDVGRRSAPIGEYVTFAFLRRGAANCEEVHSYVAYLPIVGYIILRNVQVVKEILAEGFLRKLGQPTKVD